MQLPKQLVAVRRFAADYPLPATLALGSLIMCAWALLRFFSFPATFDLVGQQLLARQWLHGGMQGATVGPTNYVLKIIFLYVPFGWTALSPRVSLILMTLLVDVVTFVFIALLLRAILRELGVKITGYFYLAMLWFVCLAGSIFWVQFTNYRNLELAGGLYLWLLGLKLLRRASWSLTVWLAIFASLLFFADPLQEYMTALPLLAFGAWQAWRHHKGWRPWLGLLAAIVAGVIGGRLLQLGVSHWLGLTFLRSGSASSALKSVAQQPLAALKGWVANNLRLLAGGADMGRWRQAVDIALWAGLLVIGLPQWRRWCRPLLAFVGLGAIIVELVYLTSGQSLQGDTSRYLIMLAPLLILAVAALPAGRWLSGWLTLGILLTVIPLGVQLGTHWDPGFHKDDHLRSVVAYLNHHDFAYVFSSMDTAIPGTYFEQPRTPLLPLECSGNSLQPQYLYYSRRAYRAALARTQSLLAVVLDGSAITTYPNSCGDRQLRAEFGTPLSVQHTSDGSAVYVYPNVVPTGLALPTSR